MTASWISRGRESNCSSFAFPLVFEVAAPDTTLTREFRGARTKDCSAMKDGSAGPMPRSTANQIRFGPANGSKVTYQDEPGVHHIHCPHHHHDHVDFVSQKR